MADSLVLTGVKDVKKHTGTEMLLTRPKRGGDTHSIREWWKAGASKCYVECTVFDVTTADGTVKLAIDSNMSTNLRIDHDGSFNFTFFGSNEVRRAALFTTGYELIEHYVFPAISGGKVMTVTPANAADRPAGAPPPTPDTTIDSVSVAGEAAPTAGDSEDYTVTVTGDATPYTYTWGVSAGGTITSGANTNTASITWNAAGTQGVTCTVSSSNANFDGNDDADTLTVNVASPPPATGPGTGVTLVGTASTQGDGSYTDVATTSANGSGLTVNYDVTSNVASNLVLNQAGSGYQEGDSFTVDGDTGVTGTVTIVVTANATSSGGGGY